MTPAEQEQIFIMGWYCYINVMFSLVATATSGIATLGILIAIDLLPLKSWKEPKAMQLLCCMVIWLFWIGQTILGYIINFGQIKLGMVEANPAFTSPLGLIIIGDIQTSLSQVMILAGDLVVCWRAWVLLPHDRFWRSVLAILMSCNIALNIAYIILNSLGENANVLAGVLEWISNGFSFLVNMAATSLIGWKAWAHYRTFQHWKI
ncbi:hypothetical protein BDP27DRAFT_1408107 [Rhodocollybia butyracea]|uniref:Uncharacterized protein n=1 Tax=Rhodocollybia butyracea TaxID=206335 RepID=A0A9P5P9H7_9AGAR|nr:hypothetical protein BDP27DRAFT_1408107 [Rhodocollybia butyracea]